MQLEKYFGVISKVINKELYTVEVDIPGKNEQLKAFPYRGEIDEPRVGDFVELEEVDPIYNSYYLYKKLKENDFIGFRTRGKKIWVNKDEFIQIGIFPPDENNNEFDSPAGEWYDGKDGKNTTPECTSWIKIDKEGCIDIEMEGTGNVHITKDHTVKIDGNLNVEVKGNADVKVTGNITATSEKNITVNGKDITVNGKNVTITGGKLNVAGQSSTDMNGPFNPIKVCPVTGSPHCGGIVSGT